MLVKDLKKIIEKYDGKEKDKIIIELYKRIPKKVKEDYDIDSYLIDINKKQDKEVKVKTIEELEKEVVYFIECAKNDLYVAPNRIISKNERSKWRFKVRSFYKELNQFVPGTVEGEKATYLLAGLFRLLSYSTHYLTFSNWETFRAIQVSQSSFYDNIMKRKFATGVNKDKLLYCIDLLKVEDDPTEGYSSMIYVFESNLMTNEIREMAIDLLKEEVIKTANELKTIKEGSRRYYFKERNNYLTECIVDINFEMAKVKDGISYFHENYIEDHKEVKEYILLRTLENFDLDNEWVIEYEKHLGKIDYRDSLKEKYNKLKN